MTKLDLLNAKGYRFRMDEEQLKPLIDEIEELLSNRSSLKRISFKKQIPKDIHSNNIIEGLDDNLAFINTIIEEQKKNNSKPINENDVNESIKSIKVIASRPSMTEEILDVHRNIGRKPVYHYYEENAVENNRVLNLFKAYNYILKKKEINKDNLRELYSLISDGLIIPVDLSNMGEYYRQDAVCITNKPYFDEKNEAINYNMIDDYMNRLFDFLNTYETDSYTSKFLVSQISHFYFVFVHPYFDCNGRTSRTLAMWYLLNNKANAFLNFNRSIPFTKGKYNRVIAYSKSTSDLTYFLKYMLNVEHSQLEKEYIINNIERSLGKKYTDDDYLILEYFLSNNQESTLITLTQVFNKVNSHNFTLDEVEERLKPFIDDNIIQQTGITNKIISSRNGYNPVYKINGEIARIDKSIIKKLNTNNLIN